MRHEINAKQLERIRNYEATCSFTSSRGEGSCKDIMTVTPCSNPSATFFRVVSHGNVIVETPDLQAAVDAYNEEP